MRQPVSRGSQERDSERQPKAAQRQDEPKGPARPCHWRSHPGKSQGMCLASTAADLDLNP